jgi:hypothetical protein
LGKAGEEELAGLWQHLVYREAGAGTGNDAAQLAKSASHRPNGIVTGVTRPYHVDSGRARPGVDAGRVLAKLEAPHLIGRSAREGVPFQQDSSGGEGAGFFPGRRGKESLYKLHHTRKGVYAEEPPIIDRGAGIPGPRTIRFPDKTAWR